jgi:hypothetical protein
MGWSAAATKTERGVMSGGMRRLEPVTVTLPPDPDGGNAERAQRASVAVDAFVGVTYLGNPNKISREDLQSTVGDLLANIKHYCDRQGFDFDHLLRRAESHYAEETASSSGVRV